MNMHTFIYARTNPNPFMLKSASGLGNYERLEFVGDACIGLLATRYAAHSRLRIRDKIEFRAAYVEPGLLFRHARGSGPIPTVFGG